MNDELSAATEPGDLLALLSAAFPFYLEINADLSVVGWGRSAPRLEENLAAGGPLSTWFTLKRPGGMDPQRISSREYDDALFILQHKRTAALLRGQLFRAPSSDRVFLLVSPWATKMTEIEDLGLTIRDFGAQDPLIDMLYLVTTRDISLADARRLADEVEQRRLEADRANTELRALTDDLQNANSELESYSYSISHDLQSPLRSIHGFAQILELEFGDELPAAAKEYLDIIRQNVGRMTDLVADLLRFSRASSAKPIREPVSFRAVAEEVVADLREAGQVPPRTEVVLHDLPDAFADRALLRQVLANLIGNACKYSRTQDRPRVVLGWEPDDGDDAYFVSDNGVGFDAAHAGRLFDVFQRLHTDSEFEGTGVGLAIAQRIVRAHGGRIWAEARPGEGATFRFTLPAEENR